MAGNVWLVQPTVVQARTCGSQHESGGHPETSHPHRGHRKGASLQKSQQPGHIAGSLGACGNFKDVGPDVGGTPGQIAKDRERRCLLEVVKRGDSGDPHPMRGLGDVGQPGPARNFQINHGCGGHQGVENSTAGAGIGICGPALVGMPDRQNPRLEAPGKIHAQMIRPPFQKIHCARSQVA